MYSATSEFGIIVPFREPYPIAVYAVNEIPHKQFSHSEKFIDEMTTLNLFYARYIHDIHYRNYEAEDCIFVDVVKYMEDCTVNMT